MRPNQVNISAVLIITLLFGLTAAWGQEKEPKGPLSTNSLYVYYVPFLNPLPERATLMPPGSFEIIFTNHYANTFRRDMGLSDPAFFISTDLESYRLALDIDYAINPFLEVGLAGGFTVHYGGFLDSLLEGFHNLFGFNNQGRDEAALNAVDLYVANTNGIWVQKTNPMVGLDNLLIKSKIYLFALPWARLSLALQPLIKIPLNSEESFLSSGKIDLGINLLFEHQLGGFIYYINLGYFYFSRPENLDIFPFNPHIFSFVLSCEWILSDLWSLYTQFDGTSSPFHSTNHWLDWFNATAFVGFKLQFRSSHVRHYAEFSFGEEFFSFANTEFSLILAYGLVF